MKAKITYLMNYGPHPWGKRDVHLWVLWEVTTPEVGPTSERPIAIFNLDSDAERFQGHVMADGLDGTLVKIEPNLRQRFESEQQLRARGTPAAEATKPAARTR